MQQQNAYLRRSLLKQFATLNAVYGAFGAVMALLLWIYFSGCVFTFGACLCAGQAEQEVEDTIVKIMKEAASGR